MAFQYPDMIRKGEDLKELNDDSIKYWHEKMHIFWNQIESGTIIPSWNLMDVYIYHKDLLSIMKEKKIIHLTPINTLDIIKED